MNLRTNQRTWLRALTGAAISLALLTPTPTLAAAKPTKAPVAKAVTQFEVGSVRFTSPKPMTPASTTQQTAVGSIVLNTWFTETQQLGVAVSDVPNLTPKSETVVLAGAVDGAAKNIGATVRTQKSDTFLGMKSTIFVADTAQITVFQRVIADTQNKKLVQIIAVTLKQKSSTPPADFTALERGATLIKK